jgi:hypothetical protein
MQSSGKKVIEHKMCVLFSRKLLSETFPILRIIQQGTAINIKAPSYV